MALAGALGASASELSAAKELAYVPGEWNHYRIEMRGPKVKVWLNRKLVQDVDLDTLTKPAKRHGEGQELLDAPFGLVAAPARTRRISGPERGRGDASVPERANRGADPLRELSRDGFLNFVERGPVEVAPVEEHAGDAARVLDVLERVFFEKDQVRDFSRFDGAVLRALS